MNKGHGYIILFQLK